MISYSTHYSHPFQNFIRHAFLFLFFLLGLAYGLYKISPIHMRPNQISYPLVIPHTRGHILDRTGTPLAFNTHEHRLNILPLLFLPYKKKILI